MADISSRESSHIISRVNSDPHNSLSIYLQHYAQIPSSFARNPLLTEFSTKHLRIEYGRKKARKTWTYNFQSLVYSGGAEKQLEEMSKAARKGLGVSELQVNSFLPFLDTTAIIGLSIMIPLQIAFFSTSSEFLIRKMPWVAKQVTRGLSFFNISPTTSHVGLGVKSLFAVPFYISHSIQTSKFLFPLFHKYRTTDPWIKVLWTLASIPAPVAVPMSFRKEAERREKLLELEGKREY